MREGMYIRFDKPVKLDANKTYFIGANGVVKEVKEWKDGFPVFR